MPSPYLTTPLRTLNQAQLDELVRVLRAFLARRRP